MDSLYREITLTINGQSRALQIPEPGSIDELIPVLELKPDRIAVEWNGAIRPRTTWGETELSTGDRLEIVQFVGGGATAERDEAAAPVAGTASPVIRRSRPSQCAP